MLKRILAAALCLLLFLLVGCGKGPDASSDSTPALQIDTSINNLTGLKDINPADSAMRPVAVMINNVPIAQGVQTNVNKADIVYETEVEGGITRLMAVFKDFSKVGQLGSVRSARYAYVDLALGHDAVYLHCGTDPRYCKPHLNDIDHISIDVNYEGVRRIKNGRSSEHTLYVFGDTFSQTIAKKFDATTKKVAPWQNFTDEKLVLDGGSAKSVTVKFPAQSSGFTYDEATGLYTRLAGGNVHKDYLTGETTVVKNVFVLLTDISFYPDKKHREIDLSKGDGFYITNGTYQFIKWSKGGAAEGFKFTDTEGKEIKVSAGKSWVCIANNTRLPVFE